ncbi:MAG TPA: zinc ABC transporter substrate-binding protein [Candidatus Hydrogenedentes bacterium]|jgi:zinc transport system substrate-binding protein|nr:zinc ABC transporter substrate-binding protein [Candidatus Hydrogenedentota bacterium]
MLTGCVAVLCALSGCAEHTAPVVAGTALLQCAVQDAGAAGAAPSVLVPPGSCPGHYDMRPSDVARVAHCDALFLHPWQELMPSVTRLIEASGIASEKVVVIPVPGNWMLPDVYAQALEAVSSALTTRGLASGRARDHIERRCAEVRALGDALRDQLIAAGAPETPVICQEMIAPVVEWAGFPVAGIFARSEDLSVSGVQALVQRSKGEAVALVIDNLQSGDEKMGAALAAELGTQCVVISNFPGGLPETDTWDQAVAENVERMLNALRQIREPAA